jgi:RND family efflux transporter MFP subunit
MPTVRMLASLAGLLMLAPIIASCGQGAPTGPASAPPPPQVTVATPEKRTVSDMQEYVGRFLAVDSVEVRARVSGYLEKVHFQDGQLVKQGDLLFTIDPRPFRNALDQARAVLAQARSNQQYADADVTRGAQLVRDKTITEQIYEQRLQTKRNAEASVLANEAAVRQAELDLEFTELRAPIAGRIGDRRVSPGNLVTGGTAGTTTLLATIVSTDPIHFEFSFDETSYLRLLRASDVHGETTGARTSMPVKLKLLDEREYKHKGRMDFLDNVIDRGSGTIRGRAELANAQGLFTPGMFARVQVAASAPYETLLVPDAAVGTEQARKFLLVVGTDDVANPKYVELGQVIDGMRVIKSGIAADDRVVVNGLMRVRPGQKVAPRPAAAEGAGPRASAN